MTTVRNVCGRSRVTFYDDRKGIAVTNDPVGAWTVTSNDGTPEKVASYTTITIVDAGDDRWLVAKETRLRNGPVRRLWKRFRGAANVRRFLGDGALSRQALEQAGLSG